MPKSHNTIPITPTDSLQPGAATESSPNPPPVIDDSLLDEVLRRRAASIVRRAEIEDLMRVTFSKVQESQKKYMEVQKELHNVSEDIQVDDRKIEVMMTQGSGNDVDRLNLVDITGRLSTSALNILALNTYPHHSLSDTESHISSDTDTLPT